MNTHMELSDFKKTLISMNQYNDWIQNYIDTYEEKEPYLTWGEFLTSQRCPLFIDVDLEFPTEDSRTIEDISTFVLDIQYNFICNKEIMDENESICYILSKNMYKYKHKYKHGFHLHFPYIILERKDCITLLSKMKESKSHPWYAKIDTQATFNPWLIYGCAKNEYSEPYKVQEIIGNQEYHHTYLQENFGELYEKYKNSEFGLYTLLFSSYFLQKRENIHIKLKDRENNNGREINLTWQDVQYILDNIHITRFNDYSQWLHIGFILFNITEGNDDGLLTWEYYSQKGINYQPNICKKKWKSMKLGELSIGTLLYMLREDNPVIYSEILHKLKKDNQVPDTHFEVAELVFEYFKDEFVYCNGWYYFTNHIWKENPKGMMLNMYLSTKFVDILKGLYGDLCMELVKKLYMSSYKRSVMEQCENLFNDNEFEEKLNSDKNKVAFINGVYDLKRHCLSIGSGKDYLSMQMPIEYQDHSNNILGLNKLQNYFQKVFVDQELREYFLNVSCESFYGSNRRKKIYVWTGNKNNGKSITCKLFEKMFGRKYAVKLPTNLITGKRHQTGAATPELARAVGGTRLIFLQEPDKSENINVGICKEMSGGDTMYIRQLYKTGCDKEIMFTPIIVCNEIPKIAANDAAFWYRIRIIDFESTFVPDCNLSSEEQYLQKKFPMDENISDELDELAPIFAWFLLQRYKYLGDKYKVPKKVEVSTDKLQKREDTISQFMEDYTVDCTEKVTINDLFQK